MADSPRHVFGKVVGAELTDDGRIVAHIAFDRSELPSLTIGQDADVILHPYKPRGTDG